MDDQGWQGFLHWSFLGEHVLLENLQLQSFWGFVMGAFLTSAICLTERLLTFALSKHWNPFLSTNSSKWRNALWRSGLYWVVTLIRLLYMLIAMSYHIGLIMITVTALAAGQFFIELFDTPHDHAPEGYLKVPLLDADQSAISRNLSRSKLDGVLIRSNDSNVTRADLSAMEMGDTHVAEDLYPTELDSWGAGKGKGAIRGGTGRWHSQQHFRSGDATNNASD